MLADAMLITVVDIDDVIPTEPLFCLLSDEDDLFVLAQNSSALSVTVTLLCSSYSLFKF